MQISVDIALWDSGAGRAETLVVKEGLTRVAQALAEAAVSLQPDTVLAPVPPAVVGWTDLVTIAVEGRFGAPGRFRVAIEATAETDDPPRVAEVCQRQIARALDRAAVGMPAPLVLKHGPESATAVSKPASTPASQDGPTTKREKTAGGPRRVELERLQRAAEESDRVRNDVVSAKRYWSECLQLDPGFVPALDGLEALLMQMEEWQELAALLQKRFDRAPPGEKAALGHKLASLFEEILDDGQAAADVYAALLRVDSRDEEAEEGLGRLALKGFRPHRPASPKRGKRSAPATTEATPPQGALPIPMILVPPQRSARTT